MDQYTRFRLPIMVLVYVILRFFGGSFGSLVLYPVVLMVTFLHEFGHALGALLTGGNVLELVINADGSGYTKSQGGNAAIILMGGYLGSAILGNILLYIGVKKRSWAQRALIALAFMMALCSIIWFQTIQTTLILCAFSVSLFFIAYKTTFDQDVLLFLGIATVLYIIQDFNVGPSSDLEQYEQVVGIFNAKVWRYFWLLLVVLITLWNLRKIFGNFTTRARA